MRVYSRRGSAPCSGAQVVLPYDLREKHRLLVRSSTGDMVSIILSRDSEPLRDGDVVASEEGDTLLIVAAPEALLEVRATPPIHLLRAAYHLGNRHVRMEIAGDCLWIGYDHVLAELLVSLGVAVSRVDRPFNPERGAYGGGHHHSHGQEPGMRYAPRIHEFGGP